MSEAAQPAVIAIVGPTASGKSALALRVAQAMDAEIGTPEQHIATGDVSPMLAWLRQNVHGVGRALNAEDLVQQVTGRPLDSTAFLRHLTAKLKALATL